MALGNYESIYKCCLCIGLVGLCLYYALKPVFYVKRGVKIGRPLGFPLIGNVLDLLPIETVLNSFKYYTKKYGKVVELFILFKRHLLISDVELTKDMLHKRPKLFRRIRSLDYSANKLGYLTGLLHINGPDWNRIRKITAPSLSKQNIINRVSQIKDIAMIIIKQFDAQADGKTVVELNHSVLTYSFRVLCLTCFGITEFNTKYSSYFFGHQFPSDVTATLKFFVESSMFPLPRWMWRYTPYYWFETHAVECDERFNSYCQAIIDEKREQYQAELSDNETKAGVATSVYRSDNDLMNKSTENNQNSLIDIMLRSEQHTSPHVDHTTTQNMHNTAVTNAEILSNVKIFFLGGSDTTAICITWALYYLSLDVDLVNALRRESDFIFNTNHNTNNNTNNTSSSVDHNDTENLKLFDSLSPTSLPLCYAILKETLRLCSPGPIVVHELMSMSDPVVMSNGLIIYPDEEIFTYLDGIMSDETVFSPNPDLFDPYRWLPPPPPPVVMPCEGGEEGKNPEEIDEFERKLSLFHEKLEKMEETFLAFGYGPRVCPGKALAFIEAILAITSITHHFNLSLACPRSEVKRVFNFAAQPNKMPITMTRRVF